MPNSLQAQVSSVLLKSAFCLLAQLLLAYGLKRELQSQEKIPRMPPNMGHTLKSFLTRELISTQPISARCPTRLSVHIHLSEKTAFFYLRKLLQEQMHLWLPGHSNSNKGSISIENTALLIPANWAGGGQGPPRVTLVMEGFMTLYGSGWFTSVELNFAIKTP